ncbi:hypothetical protein JXA63_02285 [Candidatus Woesebacteria bacterium]|nr:hypothetical protein [Candidatus Woesebacteria bacterium]
MKRFIVIPFFVVFLLFNQPGSIAAQEIYLNETSDQSCREICNLVNLNLNCQSIGINSDANDGRYRSRRDGGSGRCETLYGDCNSVMSNQNADECGSGFLGLGPSFLPQWTYCQCISGTAINCSGFSGTITDSSTSSGIPDATITWYFDGVRSMHTIMSRSDGSFTYPYPTDDYQTVQIDIVRSGYQTVEQFLVTSCSGINIAMVSLATGTPTPGDNPRCGYSCATSDQCLGASDGCTYCYSNTCIDPDSVPSPPPTSTPTPIPTHTPIPSPTTSEPTPNPEDGFCRCSVNAARLCYPLISEDHCSPGREAVCTNTSPDPSVGCPCVCLDPDEDPDCGGSSQPCCEGNTCNDGFHCELRSFRCIPDDSWTTTTNEPSDIFCVDNDPNVRTSEPDSGKIATAIGCIPVENGQALVVFLLRWGLGIAGGIALLLSSYAGFLIMTSQGVPQRLQAGKQLLTAALSGLLLIIFSATLLRLIGVDILRIPGFGPDQ